MLRRINKKRIPLLRQKDYVSEDLPGIYGIFASHIYSVVTQNFILERKNIYSLVHNSKLHRRTTTTTNNNIHMCKHVYMLAINEMYFD